MVCLRGVTCWGLSCPSLQVFVVTRENRGNCTLPWQLWCCQSNITWLKQPGHGPHKEETKHSTSPTQQSSPGRSGTQRKPSEGKVTRSPMCWKLGQRKTNSADSSCSSVSDSRRPPVKPLLWLEGHMLNKILIPIHSLISCFLEHPGNRRASLGAIEGLWRGYSSVCPKGFTICWTPVSVT